MNSYEENHLVFSEIINCYSTSWDESIGEVYIKHPSHLDSIKVEKEYFYALEKAKTQKIPFNIEKEKSIFQQNLWTKQEEDSIKDNLKFIEGMRENISREFLISRRRLLKKELYDCEKRLDSLLMKKDFLMGFTAEKYARQQSIYYQVKNSFYKDEKLIEKFSENELQDEDIYLKLIEIYNKYQKRINQDSIKNIAISPFFANLFYMAGDNAYYFFGLPVVKLTSHQSDLFMNGRYFKSLMEKYGNKLPEEMKQNPNDMIEFFEITQNVEKSGILEDDKDGNSSASSILGATKEDLRLMGVNPSQIQDIGKEIAKSKTGMLSKDDLYKMMG